MTTPTGGREALSQTKGRTRGTRVTQATAVRVQAAGSPMPTTLATSQEIRDRGSAFVGYVYTARTAEEARGALGCVAKDGAEKDRDRDRHGGGGERRGEEDGRGPYVIAAWRCMVVKPGKTGLGGPEDFVVEEGWDDGEERWAGQRVLGVMKREGVLDAVVVVRRWFGGTLLGPVRFTHVETCAGEVCRRFKKIEEMDECVRTLTTLDDILATLRVELAVAREKAGMEDPTGTAENSRAKAAPDYRVIRDSLDLTKAKRLIHARECGITATKSLIEKCKTSG